MTLWRRWLQRPQELFLRRLLFQIHLWTGIAVGIYVLVICMSGSVLVYRNELYRTFSPTPVIVAGSSNPMAVADLKSAARRVYPGYEVTDVRRGETPNHAIEITLRRGSDMKRRLLHPFTGGDLGDPVPAGFRFTAWLLDLHDNLLLGETGRRINGIGALFVTLLCVTGAIIWWPGIKSWRGSLIPDRRANWKRLNWSLHSTLGFWGFAFILRWGVTGMYLSFPRLFAAAFDVFEPFDASNPVERVVDRIQYWLAYLHFGRLGGRGIPGCGRGLCDSTTKVIWAAFGLVPPLMFVTGALMWLESSDPSRCSTIPDCAIEQYSSREENANFERHEQSSPKCVCKLRTDSERSSRVIAVPSCPYDCPCEAPKQRFQSQREPTRLICEVEKSEGFTRKTKMAEKLIGV